MISCQPVTFHSVFTLRTGHDMTGSSFTLLCCTVCQNVKGHLRLLNVPATDAAVLLFPCPSRIIRTQAPDWTSLWLSLSLFLSLSSLASHGGFIHLYPATHSLNKSFLYGWTVHIVLSGASWDHSSRNVGSFLPFLRTFLGEHTNHVCAKMTPTTFFLYGDPPIGHDAWMGHLGAQIRIVPK